MPGNREAAYAFDQIDIIPYEFVHDMIMHAYVPCKSTHAPQGCLRYSIFHLDFARKTFMISLFYRHKAARVPKARLYVLFIFGTESI